MKKMKVLAVVLAAGLLLFSCASTRDLRQQDELTTYYSMVYQLGEKAFDPIAETHLGRGDRVLIVNVGQGYLGFGARYEYKVPDDAEGFSYDAFIEDHPLYIEYFENGIISSILNNKGVGFERMSLAPYAANYPAFLREGNLVFNTSMLNYEYWQDVKEEFGVNKVLIYSVNNVIEDPVNYIGVQSEFKFIDLDADGKVLYDEVVNLTSSDFPPEKEEYLHRFELIIPEAETEKFIAALEEKMSDAGISSMDAVLVKSDDIGLFGNYPMTVEDLVVEQVLANELSSSESLNILEKLFKRQYKTSYQLTNAVTGVNPFMGGDYSEFEKYYNTRYMLSYRVLWDEQTGKINEVNVNRGIVSLKEKALGIFIKVIDMSDDGNIILTHLLPVSDLSRLETNFLYRVFNQLSSQEQILASLESSLDFGAEDRSVVINKRMEIFKNYLINRSPSYEAIFGNFGSQKDSTILAEYDKVYKLFDEEKWTETKGDIYYIAASFLINSWAEEGLTHLMVSNGYQVQDKLESVYSRYLLSQKYDKPMIGSNPYLSPLLLQDWGQNIKQFYNIDKIVYFIGLEKNFENSGLISPDKLTGKSAAIEISQYYPILSDKFKNFMLSVLDVQNGNYVLNDNIDLSSGGN